MRMNIIYFLDDWSGFGGAANNLLHQAYAMQWEGNRVKVVLPENEEGEYSKEAAKRCGRYGLGFVRLRFFTATSIREINIYEAIRDSIAVENFLLTQGADLVHSIQLNIAEELACRGLGIGHVMSIYSIYAGEFRIPYVDIFPKYLICDSEFYSRLWEMGLKVKTRCIRNCMDRKEKGYGAPWHKKRNEVLEVLTLGHIYKAKNQLEIIKFVDKCISGGILIRLTLCGDDVGAYADVCRTYVEENGLDRYVLFKGFVSDITGYLKNADLLLCGSTRESFPFSITESMMFGVPVLTTCAGGIPELIKDGWNGYLAEGYDAKSIYVKFKEFLADRETGRIESVIANSYETYLKNNTPEVVAARIRNFYEVVISRKERHSALICRSGLESGLQNIKSMFEGNKSFFNDEKYVYSRLWYIYSLQNSPLGKRRLEVYIWGAGKLGREAGNIVKVFFKEWVIKGYMDAFKTGSLDGYCIHAPDEVVASWTGLIIVANYAASDEIILSLESRGKQCGSDFILMI